jgi:DNA-binding MarR family transcriptional regulator
MRLGSLGTILVFALFIGGVVLSCASMGSAVQADGEFSAVTILHSLRVGNVSDTGNLSAFYSQISSDPSIEAQMVTMNGERTELIQLPQESVAVILPDDRLAVRYGDEPISLLPNGSSMTEYRGSPCIRVPDQRSLIAVSDLVVSPVGNFTSTALMYQHVQELDEYQLKVIFPLAKNQDGPAVISRYSIEWGDGSQDRYLGDQVTASHAYQSSGVYYMQIHATDSLGVTYSTVQVYSVQYEGNLAHTYLWAKKNQGPVVSVFSTGIGLLVVSAFAFTESGKYRLLSFLALFFPMYTRIQKEDVLDQFVRGQIYGYIKTNPGVHYNQILREIGVKNGTLSYHLGVLEKTQLIKSRREGLKYRAFYLTDMMFPKEERFRLTELQVRIIKEVTEHPGSTQKEISRHLEQKPQTVNYNVKVLEQAGIIRVQRRGRKTRCYPPEPVAGEPAASPAADEL